MAKSYKEQIREQEAERKRAENRAALAKRIKEEKERRALIEEQQSIKKERKIRDIEAKTKKVSAQAKLAEEKRRLKKAKPQSKISRVIFGKSKKKKHSGGSGFYSGSGGW
jgi:hypothetical protein